MNVIHIMRHIFCVLFALTNTTIDVTNNFVAPFLLIFNLDTMILFRGYASIV